MVYIQDCIQSRVMKALKAQMGSLKIAKSNFAKTADLVAHSDVQIIKAAHIPQKTKNTAPTVYIQGFRTIKEVASLASVGKPFLRAHICQEILLDSFPKITRYISNTIVDTCMLFVCYTLTTF